ncbi:50S ribosomal protein L22 [Candidatus Magnetaquicoccaceae bacterium FCR-1]|uniref:Large ribosomal subunit protein uL22 n=1 Tax=Candidatus Magnetaquiglobus chichijimensis TaxID=3141448 RepID=A0ABQ0CAV9_9PROT
MEAVARLRNLPVSPTKVRLVVDLIRGLRVENALRTLEFSKKRVANSVRETLKSAIANAENNFGLDVDTLVVYQASVDQGLVMKRFRPRARGRAGRVTKRTSHLTITVRSTEP